MKFVLLLSFLSLAASAADLEFKIAGKRVITLSLSEQERFAKPMSIRVNELHEGKEVTFHASNFKDILKRAYGDYEKLGDEILFTCADGYQPSIPLARFRKHASFLATAKADGSPFRFSDLKTKAPIEYGPHYLIWDNLSDEEIRKEGNEDWPYQIVSVDIIRFSDKFPKLAPPAKRTAQVERGFLAYRKQCLQCHTINGEGGAKAVELNYPVAAVEYFKPEHLKKWISDPAQIRFGATMPAIDPNLPGRDKVIDDIIAYLKVMSQNKKAPEKSL